MEIVLIRHGQPEWMLNDEYTRNPGLTELGSVQSKKSADQFAKGSIDQLWVSPLNRAAQTLTPFEENEVAKEIKTFEWLKEMEDKDEVALYGKSSDEIMSFFAFLEAKLVQVTFENMYTISSIKTAFY